MSTHRDGIQSDSRSAFPDTSTVPEISICNVHDGSASFGQPEQRPQDGLQQNSFRRLLSDPYFSVTAAFRKPLMLMDCPAHA
jgi:hypothetical protein